MYIDNQTYKFTCGDNTITAYLIYVSTNNFHVCKSLGNTGAYSELNIRVSESDFLDKDESDLAIALAKLFFENVSSDINVCVYSSSICDTPMFDFVLDSNFNVLKFNKKEEYDY